MAAEPKAGTAMALPAGWGRARLYPDRAAVPKSRGRRAVRAYDASGRALAWRPERTLAAAACDVERADTPVGWLARHFELEPAELLARWVCSETLAKLEGRPVHDLVARRGLAPPLRSGEIRRVERAGTEILYLATAGLHLALGRRLPPRAAR